MSLALGLVILMASWAALSTIVFLFLDETLWAISAHEGNRTYGMANPGYMPAAEGDPLSSPHPQLLPRDPALLQPACLTACLAMKEQWQEEEVDFCPLRCLLSQFLSLNLDLHNQVGISHLYQKILPGRRLSCLPPASVATIQDQLRTYRLETFTESRSTEWSHEPYRGQPVDAFAQPPPGPWDVPAKASTFFVDDQQIMKVPYTSSTKPCHVCVGMGRRPCKDCAGAGNKVCWVCNGSGFRHGDDRCHHCSGRGRENCSRCQGKGSLQCDTCHGQQQLLVYINLTVKWINNSENYVVEQSSGLQADNLSKVSGKELFRDTQYLVYPLVGFPDPTVVNAAQRLVHDHQGKYSRTSRILQQRQTIELIPVTKITYSWKGKSHIYFVYGNEFTVNADDYPATCCCTVM
ncbi:hypothetical protein F7725_000856 [Dissostichus mawsoni]|uniref:Protein SSUH2 homolog n=1 Tax=Dissostichus mawsoni TaxID=36200 RepID=A0A7J5ZHI9_DISMA|nr:hypothetical protein F7725_000856 [Dissostichus mawsoni]